MPINQVNRQIVNRWTHTPGKNVSANHNQAEHRAHVRQSGCRPHTSSLNGTAIRCGVIGRLVPTSKFCSPSRHFSLLLDQPWGGGDSASTTQADTWLPKKQIRTAADKVFVPPDSADISKMQMDWKALIWSEIRATKSSTNAGPQC